MLNAYLSGYRLYVFRYRRLIRFIRTRAPWFQVL